MQPFYPVNWIKMLPEKLEQLQSRDQSFWFRLMVTTDSTEVTGIGGCPAEAERAEGLRLRG